MSDSEGVASGLTVTDRWRGVCYFLVHAFENVSLVGF